MRKGSDYFNSSNKKNEILKKCRIFVALFTEYIIMNSSIY